VPIYEYRCKRCGASVEVIQRITDPPLRKCRDCSGPLEKLVSVSSFQLKGSGWYMTDYGRTSRTSAAREGGGEKGPKSSEKPATEGAKDSSSSGKPAAEGAKDSSPKAKPDGK